MKIVSWITGVFFALIAASMFYSNDFLSSTLVVLAALIVIPKTREVIQIQLSKKGKQVNITNGIAIIGGITFVIISGFFLTPAEQKLPQAMSNVELANKAQIEKQDTQPRVYINELLKLQELTQQLVDYKYQPQYSSYETFARIKENLAIAIEPTCNYFDELMRTTGNMKSPHLDDSIRCSDTVLSMTAVMFDLRDGDHKAIKAQRESISIINDHLVNQLDEYRNTPAYQAELKKYLVE